MDNSLGRQALPVPASSIGFSYRVLFGILFLATILRVTSAFMQGDTVGALPGIYDQISYDRLAQQVVEGHGFYFATDWWPATRAGEPTAHWSYLYTLYLATVYTLFGVEPLAARLIQAVLVSLLHCWLIWRIGRQVFGHVVGLVAAGISAVYTYFVFYAGALLTESFYIVAILWVLDIALRLTAIENDRDSTNPNQMTNYWLWLELGLAIGVATLLRQVFLLFIPFLFLWLWWNLVDHWLHTPQNRLPEERSGRLFITRARCLYWPVFKGSIVTALVVFILIVPWTIRNYRVFGTFVPLNTNSGFAFFWGNHPIQGTHFVGILPYDGPSYQELIPVELRHLNEAELDRALLKLGIGIVLDDPVRYILLSISRTREYFKFWPSSESGTLSNLARVSSFGLFLPFMLYGLWIAWVRIWRLGDQRQRMVILLLLLFIVVYTTIHLLVWTLIRYRLPVDALLLIFAALGIAQLLPKSPNDSGRAERVTDLS